MFTNCLPKKCDKHGFFSGRGSCAECETDRLKAEVERQANWIRLIEKESAALRAHIKELKYAGDAIEMFAEGFANSRNITSIDGEPLSYWQKKWKKAKEGV